MRLTTSIVLALAAACSSGGSGSASFTGTVRGQTFSPKDAISANTTISTASGPANVAAIVLVNQTGLCGDVNQNKEPKNSQYFAITLGVLQGGAFVTPTATGDFAVYSGSGSPSSSNIAIVGSRTTDAQCKYIASYDAMGASGTVHLSSISNGAYSGAFDVNVQGSSGAADHVTGTFSASNCAILGTLISSNASTTCI